MSSRGESLGSFSPPPSPKTPVAPPPPAPSAAVVKRQSMIKLTKDEQLSLMPTTEINMLNLMGYIALQVKLEQIAEEFLSKGIMRRPEYADITLTKVQDSSAAGACYLGRMNFRKPFF